MAEHIVKPKRADIAEEIQRPLRRANGAEPKPMTTEVLNATRLPWILGQQES